MPKLLKIRGENTPLLRLGLAIPSAIFQQDGRLPGENGPRLHSGSGFKGRLLTALH